MKGDTLGKWWMEKDKEGEDSPDTESKRKSMEQKGEVLGIMEAGKRAPALALGMSPGPLAEDSGK